VIQIKKYFSNKNIKLFYVGVFAVIFASLKIFPLTASPLIVYLLFVFATRKYLPSDYSLQQLALAGILPIAFSPLYLVARGFLTSNSLTNLDLYMYLIILGFLYFAFAKNKKKYLSSEKSKTILNRSDFILGLSTLFFLTALELSLRTKSLGDAVAWIASGDNKNHVVFAFDISRLGMLEPAALLFQPISAPSFLSLLFGQKNQEVMSNSELVSFQMQVFANTWVLILGLIGIAFAATAQIIWTQMFNSKPVPRSLLFIAAIAPLLSVISGPALYDGFFTALLAIGVLTVLINWFLEGEKSQQGLLTQLILGFLIFLASIFSWMFLVMVTFPLLISRVWLTLSKRLNGNNHQLNLITSVLIVGLLLSIHFSSFGQSLIRSAKVALSASGAVNVSSPDFYIFLILVLFLASYFIQAFTPSLSSAIKYLALLNAIGLMAFKWFSNLELSKWNYYVLKYQWILTASLFAVTSILILAIIINSLGKIGVLNSVTSKIVFMFVSLGSLYFLSEAVSPTKGVWITVSQGWENPRSSVVNQMLSTDLDFNVPTLFFHHGYHGDSMLANFWMTAYTNPREPIRGWNYTIDTNGDVQQLCDVNSYYSTVNVVTIDSELQGLLKETCPTEVFTIELREVTN
jgi:hypothetical protein